MRFCIIFIINIWFENLIHHLILKYYLFVNQTINHHSARNTFQALEPLGFCFMGFFKFFKNKMVKLILRCYNSVLKCRKRCDCNYIIRLKKNILIVSKFEIISDNKVNLNCKKYEKLLVSLQGCYSKEYVHETD